MHLTATFILKGLKPLGHDCFEIDAMDAIHMRQLLWSMGSEIVRQVERIDAVSAREDA